MSSIIGVYEFTCSTTGNALTSVRLCALFPFYFHNVRNVAIQNITDFQKNIGRDIIALAELCDDCRANTCGKPQIFPVHLLIYQQFPQLVVADNGHFYTSTLYMVQV